MDFSKTLTDDATLEKLGSRIAQYRLDRNLTQKELAKKAGISVPTVTRIEAGESSQLGNLVRILRALDLLANLENLVPDIQVSPIQQLKLKGKARQRASSKKASREKPDTPWRWNLPQQHDKKRK